MFQSKDRGDGLYFNVNLSNFEPGNEQSFLVKHGAKRHML